MTAFPGAIKSNVRPISDIKDLDFVALKPSVKPLRHA